MEVKKCLQVNYSYYFTKDYKELRGKTDEIDKQIDEITDNKDKLEAMLEIENSEDVSKFTKLLEEFKNERKDLENKLIAFLSDCCRMDYSLYSYNGNDPVVDVATQQYNQNQKDKQQQLNDKRGESRFAAIKAYSNLERKLKKIKLVLRVDSPSYYAIITPYREKKRQEEQAAANEKAAKEKVAKKKAIRVAVIITIVTGIILFLIIRVTFSDAAIEENTFVFIFMEILACGTAFGMSYGIAHAIFQ